MKNMKFTTPHEHINACEMAVVTGSRLYGTHTAESDTDIRGFIVMDADFYLSRHKKRSVWEYPPDTTIWEFGHFLNQLVSGSPNTIEILFAPEDSFLIKKPIGEYIIKNRSRFITKKLVRNMLAFALGEYNTGVAKRTAHAVRLVSQAESLINTGQIVYPLACAEYLRSIKTGEIRVTTVKESVERVHKEIDACNLPDSVDEAWVDTYYQSIVRRIITESK